MAVLDGSKTSRRKKIFFRKKNGHMAHTGSRRAQKWANFFFSPHQNFTPGKRTQKGARNAGAYDFHDIWAFGGPSLVKNGHSTIKKNGHFFKMPMPRCFCRKVDTKRVLTSPQKSGCDQCGGFTMVALICSIWGGDVSSSRLRCEMGLSCE